MKLFLGTYNCGNNDVDISWKQTHDICVIGAQEARPEFLEKISANINNETIICEVEMYQIKLFIICKQSIGDNISNISIGSVGTGILTIGVNKGAVWCSFNLYNHKFLFICSHLAAGIKEISRRNADYTAIVNSINNFYHYDYIFWMGDLNYRINGEYNDIVKMTNEGNWQWLYKRDQLIQEIVNSRAFIGFEESSIKFPPTYKFTNGEYDIARNPSWCDRILYFSRYNMHLEAIEYKREDIDGSDHKPVWGLFSIDINDYPIRIIKISNIEVKIFRGFDINGLCDPYIIFSGITRSKTKIIKKTLHARWNEKIKIKACNSIYITAKDWDLTSKNDIIGKNCLFLSLGHHNIYLYKGAEAVGIISFSINYKNKT